MFFYVRYKDNQVKVFNRQCNIYNLLEYIKAECGYGKNMKIDVCDEQGAMIHLSEQMNRNGSDYLQHRHTYILVKVQDLGGYGVTFTPMIDISSDEDKHLESVLQSQNTFMPPSSPVLKLDPPKPASWRGSSKGTSTSSSTGSRSRKRQDKKSD